MGIAHFQLTGGALMNREEFAKRIYWARIIWIAGIINPSMMLPQLYQLWSTGIAQGISLGTLGIIIFIQGAFSVHGFFIRDRLVMISNGLACIMSALTAIVVFFLR